MRNRFDKKAFDFFLDSEILDTKGYRRIPKAVFDPNAYDADGDGMVQDSTRFQRPKKPGTSSLPSLNVPSLNVPSQASAPKPKGPKPKGPKPKPVSIRENRNDRMTDWGRGLRDFAKNPQSRNPYANGYYELEGIEDLVTSSQQIRRNPEFWQIVPSGRRSKPMGAVEYELSKKGRAEFKKLVNAEKLKRNNERKKFEADVIRYFGEEHLEGYKKDGLRHLRNIEDNNIRSEFRKYITKNKNLSASDIVTSMAKGTVVPNSELTPEQKQYQEKLKQQLIDKIRKVYSNRAELVAESIIDGLEWNPEETFRFFWEKLKSQDSSSVPGGIRDITDKRDAVIGAIMDYLDYSPRKLPSSPTQKKSLRRSVGRASRSLLPGGGRRGGGGGRRFALNSRFDPDARDADNDGVVQEMTRWERPAGPRNIVQPAPRNIVQPLSSAIQGEEEESDLDEILRNFERNRQRNRPFRLTAPDDDFDPDKPSKPDKPVDSDRRNRPFDRSRLIDPSKPISADNIRNPKILPLNPGEPMVVEIRGMSKADWNDLINSYEDYFLEQQESAKQSSKKAYALFALRDALRKTKVKDTEDGIELDSRDWHFARIVKGLEELKKRGAEFDNGDKIIKYLESQMKRQGRSSRSIDLDQFRKTVDLPFRSFESVQDKKRDAQKVSDELKALEKKVERAFGKITTKQDALSAFKRAHPEITKHFDFLWGQTGDLSPSERGLVFGYLNMFLEHPELKNYVIKFSVEKKAGVGGSAGYELPWDADNSREFDKMRLVIRYKADQTGLSLNELALLRLTGTKYADTVARQASVSYIRNNPDGLNDTDLLERAVQIYDSKIAEHEATHIAHYIASIEDAFPGKNADGKVIMDGVRSLVASEGKEGVMSNYLVGLSVNLLDIAEDRLKAADKILNAFDARFSNLKKSVREFHGRDLTPDEIKGIQELLITDIMNQNPILDEIWQNYFPDFVLDSNDPDSFTRANLLAGRNYAQRQKAAIDKLLKTQKYKVLQDRYEELKQKKKTKRDLFGNFTQGPTIEKLGVQFPDLMREFWQDVMEETEVGSAQRYINRFDDESYYKLAFGKIMAQRLNDDLDRDEQKLLRTFGKKISRYAGTTASQFYGYQNGTASVEAVAELTGALTAGQLPEKGTPEYNAIKKFIIWLKGSDYWDRIETQNG